MQAGKYYYICFQMKWSANKLFCSFIKYRQSCDLTHLINNIANNTKLQSAQSMQMLNRKAKVYLYKIENAEFSNGTSPGTTRQLNIIRFLYLGGTDTYSIVSRSTGCIDELMVCMPLLFHTVTLLL